MTKQEYTEFLNLQEHYEWLHAAEDRAIDKLATFTTDDSEFDELIHKAIKVYFETEIDKAWKKIEEFKTAPTFVADREDAIRYWSKRNDKLEIYGAIFKVSEIQEAKRVCTSGPCGHESCPLAGRRGCVRIWEAYDNGNYKEV